MSYHTYFSAKPRVSRTVLLVLMCLVVIIVFSTYKVDFNVNFNERIEVKSFVMHNTVVDWFYEGHSSLKTSKLGAVLYKNEPYPEISENNRNKTYVILIWRHWKILQNRHLYYFGPTSHDPLEGCSVTNCVFTGDDDQLNTADAVVVHLHRGVVPEVASRNRSQRWIFLNDESPFNVFALAKHKPSFSSLHNVFNWSMTYASSADVPVPYGRTVPLKAPKFLSSDIPIAKLVPNWETKRRDVLAAVLISNCGVGFRMNIINKLKSYMKVNVHGQCGEKELKNSCPGHFRSDCDVLSDYLFYLSLENSKCEEYMTEKLFYNAYYRGAIPIIQGPSIQECETFLPPNSYLHVDNFESIAHLAAAIAKISENDNELLKFHMWRNHFDVANEHGYFGTKSFHLCRLCEAMNYNDEKERVYTEEDLKLFLDRNTLCRNK